MSESNGKIIRVDRKGLKKFAFGDNGKVFEVDVVAILDQWGDIDRDFRDDKGDIPKDQWTAYNGAAVAFVFQISQTEGITGAEALEFIAKVTDEVDSLRDFFVPKSRKGASLPAPTEVTYSK